MIIRSSIQTLTAAMLLVLAGTVMAQEDVGATVAAESGNALPAGEHPDSVPKISPVQGQDIITTATADLVGSTTDLTTAPGACPVVDIFVQQFCAANPDDISCQFQSF